MSEATLIDVRMRSEMQVRSQSIFGIVLDSDGYDRQHEKIK